MKKRFLRRAIRHPSFAVGASILLIAAVVAVLGPTLSPYDANDLNLRQRLLPPAWNAGGTWSHPLGTDSLGRDLLSRILVGSRISLLVGFCAVAVQGVVGTALGLLAGYRGGWVDNVITRLADIQLSIPFLVLALAVGAALGPGLLNIILVLGVTGWAMYARVARALTLQVKETDFVEAARAIGQGSTRIAIRHILPNVLSSLGVTATFQMARMIISESSLSFLGVGVPLEVTTWGSMIAAGRDYVSTAWWIATLPGLAILVTVLSINLMGNALRDILDPRFKV